MNKAGTGGIPLLQSSSQPLTHPEELHRLFRDIDTNGNGRLDKSELQVNDTGGVGVFTLVLVSLHTQANVHFYYSLVLPAGALLRLQFGGRR